jgi:error-prone DNA polymerase
MKGLEVSYSNLRAGQCLRRAAAPSHPRAGDSQSAVITLAREFHLPLLATNGPNMATAFEREVLDLMSAIRHGCTLGEAGLLLQQNSNRRMLGAKEMTTLFRDLPSAVAETVELSSRLRFVMKDMGYQFPLYPIPEGETMDSYLSKRTMEGCCQSVWL